MNFLSYRLLNCLADPIAQDIDFPSMSYEDWQTAVQPKVLGTWNLHYASLGLDLDFFLLFSSWSGLVGQWGQANYAAVSVSRGHCGLKVYD